MESASSRYTGTPVPPGVYIARQGRERALGVSKGWKDNSACVMENSSGKRIDFGIRQRLKSWLQIISYLTLGQ